MMVRIPIYILVDTSSSMRGKPIERVKKGISEAIIKLRQSPFALDMVSISIITYNTLSQQVLPLIGVDKSELPEIIVPESGTSHIGSALKYLYNVYNQEVVSECENRTKTVMPFLFILTNGKITDISEFEDSLILIKQCEFKEIVLYSNNLEKNNKQYERLSCHKYAIESINIHKWIIDAIGEIVEEEVKVEEKKIKQVECINEHNPVYISYAWAKNDKSDLEKEVVSLCRQMKKNGINYKRDKEGLCPYRWSIQESKEEIGQGSAIIIIISDRYIKSIHCMHEWHLIKENGKIWKRVFPIVLDDVQLVPKFKKYLNYFNNRKKRLQKKVSEDIEPLTFTEKEALYYGYFINDLKEMYQYLSDTNTAKCTIRKNNFKIVIEQLKKYIYEIESTYRKNETITNTQGVSEPQPIIDNNISKNSNTIKRIKTMTRRLPVFILIDTSGSMKGEPIEAVKVGLADMVATLRQDPYALETVCVSIVTYDQIVKQILPLTPLEDIQLPEITVPDAGPTHTGAALEKLCEMYDKDVFKGSKEQKGDWMPLLFLLTDGKPSDIQVYNNAIKKVKSHAFTNIVACAAGPKAKTEHLKQLTDNVVSLDTMDSKTFGKFFQWVSQQVIGGGKSIGTTSSIELPKPPAEVNLVI